MRVTYEWVAEKSTARLLKLELDLPLKLKLKSCLKFQTMANSSDLQPSALVKQSRLIMPSRAINTQPEAASLDLINLVSDLNRMSHIHAERIYTICIRTLAKAKPRASVPV
jgi:hypothetical protein